MYKKILVPLDGSERAEAVLPHVIKLASDQTQIIFLQVIEPQFVFTEPHGYTFVDIQEISYKSQQEHAETYLSDLVGEFKKKNFNAKSIIEFGPIAHSIIRVAEDENVDLIAMASHGRTGLAHVFYGSVAASVLHLVDRPLLLIRA